MCVWMCLFIPSSLHLMTLLQSEDCTLFQLGNILSIFFTVFSHSFFSLLSSWNFYATHVGPAGSIIYIFCLSYTFSILKKKLCLGLPWWSSSKESATAREKPTRSNEELVRREERSRMPQLRPDAAKKHNNNNNPYPPKKTTLF